MRSGLEASPRTVAFRLCVAATVTASGQLGCEGCGDAAGGAAPREAASTVPVQVGSVPGSGAQGSPFPAFSVDAPAVEPRAGEEWRSVLDAEIADLERLRGSTESRERLRHATLLLERFDALRRPDDLQRATELVSAMRELPTVRDEVRLLRAEIALARGELGALVGPAQGPPLEPSTTPRVAEIQAEALFAQGRCESALTILRAIPAERRSERRAALDAVVLGALGRDAEAIERFRAATRSHREPSPSSLARIHVAHARFLQGRGEMAAAQTLYAEALKRADWYEPALLGLAELVGPARGIALLEPVTGGDGVGAPPELLARVAELRDMRAPGSGTASLWQAARAYSTAMEIAPRRYRPGFARFTTYAVEDPARGFELAERALGDEPTLEAYALLLDVARASGRVDAWCEYAARSSLVPHCAANGEPPASLPRCR
jgi:tetratricopeptide (TPR) repeat protein